MSRLKKFTKSLLSGYLTLAANAVYAFASVPIALRYLSDDEFGVWALAMQVGLYLAAIDLGMSGSVSRILIDHKDDPAKGAYGSIIKTGALVGAIQGLIILLLGAFLAGPLGQLLHVNQPLRPSFTWLLIGQSAITAVTFATRIFTQILVAHQRYDISNYAQAIVYAASLPIMWIAFRMGLGVYSLLAAQLVGIGLQTFVTLIAVQRLKLFPARGQWGAASRARFNELFAYGGSLFLLSIGFQLITATQVILLTRFSGLAVAARWTVCTRVYSLIGQIIWRGQEYSGPPLAEMYVRGEMDRMRDRLRDMAYMTTNVALVGALFIAVCNNTFVQLWTHGRMSWDGANDVLLAVWLIVATAMRAHVNLAGATKRFGLLSYVCIAEGLTFVALNIGLRKVDGLTRMLALSILCTTCFSLLYTLHRSRSFFSLSWPQIGEWHRTTARTAWRLAIVGLAAYWLTRDLPLLPRLISSALICGTFGGWIFLRYGFARELQKDIADKLPPPIRKVVLAVPAA